MNAYPPPDLKAFLLDSNKNIVRELPDISDLTENGYNENGTNYVKKTFTFKPKVENNGQFVKCEAIQADGEITVEEIRQLKVGYKPRFQFQEITGIAVWNKVLHYWQNQIA